MIVYNSNILAVPLVILLWTVDVYLSVVGLRLLLGQLSVTRDSRVCQALQEIVDPLTRWVNHKLTAWRHRPSPGWIPWTTVIVAGLIIRHVLLMIVVSMSQP